MQRHIVMELSKHQVVYDPAQQTYHAAFWLTTSSRYDIAMNHAPSADDPTFAQMLCEVNSTQATALDTGGFEISARVTWQGVGLGLIKVVYQPDGGNNADLLREALEQLFRTDAVHKRLTVLMATATQFLAAFENFGTVVNRSSLVVEEGA